MSPQSAPKKVAVIAVHGVSDQRKEESAAAIAKLLHDRYPSPSSSDSNTNQPDIPKHSLSVPVAPVNVQVPPADNGDCPNDHQQAWFSFMEKRLADYQGDKERNYNTVRFSVCDRPQLAEREIHIYEMYWADLSRLGNGVVRFFGSFFQLLFHLSTLGDETLRLAVEETQTETQAKNLNSLVSWALQILLNLHQFCNVLITLLIPTLVLGLLSASFISLPRLIPGEVLGLIDTVAIFIGLYIGIFCIANYLFNANQTKSFFGVFSLPIIAIVSLYATTIIGNYRLGSILWLVVLIVLSYVAFLKPYQKRDPRLLFMVRQNNRKETSNAITSPAQDYSLEPNTETTQTSNKNSGEQSESSSIQFKTINWLLGVLGLLAIVSIVFLISEQNTGLGITIASFHQVEVIVFCLASAWILFNTLHLLFAVVSMLAVLFLKFRPPSCAQLASRLNRAIWTGLVSLSAPSSIFFIVNVVLWSALVLGVSNRLLINGPEEGYAPIIFTHTEQFMTDGTGSQLTFVRFAELLLKMTATSGLLVVLVLVAFVAIGALWAFLPSIRYEANPNNHSRENNRTSEPALHNPETQTETDPEINASNQLGRWLTSGLILIAQLTLILLTLAMAVIFTMACYQGLLEALLPDNTLSVPVVNRLGHWITTLLPEWLKHDGTTERVLFLFSTLTVGSISALLSFGDRAERFFALFRSVLDAVLDVDNHLRLYPKECNPRAQIAARYVSLLRFISGQKYDKVIIVAHSQGTVISADLLKYLHCKPDPDLASLPAIALFTMGCPLRQLYGFGFPHLYRWVNAHGDQLINDTTIKHDANPNPAKLFRVEQWVNVFGSGDYIGRDLWRTGPQAQQWSPNTTFSGPMRKEYCLGAGAHTHYWDGTFPQVVEELDRLIQ